MNIKSLFSCRFIHLFEYRRVLDVINFKRFIAEKTTSILKISKVFLEHQVTGQNARIGYLSIVLFLSVTACLATFPAFAQLGAATTDDGLLGGLIPRTATQTPVGPAIVGGSSPVERAAFQDRETLLRQTIITNNIDPKNTDTKPADPSEFQKYVQQIAGTPVPYFGANFFINNPSTFAPVQNIPVPSDYEFGPGDEVVIRAWGGINIDYRAILDRNGFINIPAVGSLMLNGVKSSQAEALIRNQIGKSFSNFQIKVTPGQIRAIRIYVVGQAQKPGTYTVSSLSTLVTAMFVTGGPGPKGSMRNVELKRNGKTIATMDLYAFIAKGDKSKDVGLLEGDTIFIPPAFGHVAIVGKVETPAIYEIKDNNESIASLLSLTGGLPIVADPLLATLQRIDPQRRPSVFNVQVKLDPEGQKQSLHNGDILTILPISTGIPLARRDIYVRIDGEVQKPGLYQVKFGETTQDLIQKAGGLTPQAYVFATSFYREATRINQEEAYKRLLSRLEATIKSRAATTTVNTATGADAAVIAQKNQAALAAAQAQLDKLKTIKPEGRIALQINPKRNDADDIPDIVLEPGDRLVIPAKNDFVQVYGAVNIESSLVWRNNSSVNDYLKISGVQREADISSIFVIRADGTILSEEGGAFSSISNKSVYSGDTIVVPERFDRESAYTAFMRGLKDWTLVLAQFGLAAAAIQVFK